MGKDTLGGRVANIETTIRLFPDIYVDKVQYEKDKIPIAVEDQNQKRDIAENKKNLEEVAKVQGQQAAMIAQNSQITNDVIAIVRENSTAIKLLKEEHEESKRKEAENIKLIVEKEEHEKNRALQWFKEKWHIILGFIGLAVTFIIAYIK